MHRCYLFPNSDKILTSYQLSQGKEKVFQENDKYLKIFVFIFVMWIQSLQKWRIFTCPAMGFFRTEDKASKCQIVWPP